jgi:hypothetical protein
MSKCDISIVFDRDDRTYVGGETVTGRVVIQVNEAVNCKGITLTHVWKTHGKGNIDWGPKETIELASAGPLASGETLNYSFSVQSPRHPLTYHGTLINVDHYICVEVDVPWARNPKAEEEYVLQAGEPPAEFTGSRGAVIAIAAKPAATNSLAAKMAFWFLMGLLLLIAVQFAICLAPVLVILVAFFWIRSSLLTGRLGEVQLSIPNVVIGPGEDWMMRLQFQPRKRFRINGIYLTLTGRESATSGSGTSATTTVQNLVEFKTAIRPADILEAGEPIDETFSMQFPETTAYSFAASDNKIEWSAHVRIDIPLFPDWTKNQPLQVVPLSFLKNLTLEQPAANTPVNTSSGSPSAAIPVPAATVTGTPARSQPRGDDSSAETPTEEAPQDLLELVAQINSANRHGNARASIVASVRGATFGATVLVDRVNSSLGLLNNDTGYEGGKTVVGTVQGTEQAIQVLTPKSLNDDVDDLRRGDVWPLVICIDGWDNLYNRINARQLEE